MKPLLFLSAGLALAAQPVSPEALTAHLREVAVVHLAFRQIRTCLQFNGPNNQVRSLLVTSAMPGRPACGCSWMAPPGARTRWRLRRA